ncbi:MAG: EAL domain-containing protein, partial [Oceanococcaceae bacterium]
VALTCAASSLDEIREWCSARLRQISRQIFAVGDKQLTTTASVVITALPPPPRDASAALATAGQALAALHAEGNNSAVRITGDAAEELQRREESKRWADQVRLALSEGHFALAFQGVACLTDDPSEYTDVLMRLNDADGKPVQAKEFMPAAQEHGLMGDIDRWVVSAALERLKHLHEQRKRQVFFVRLDIASVQQANAFLQWMEPLWKASGLPTGSMVMVLRERMLQTQMRSGTNLLNGLRSLGVATGIDHFGISSQSAELLRRLPVDYVKLHADFTAAVSNPGADLSSFREIMDVAKQQKIRTIAERVASANDMARLWQMGVNFLMGSHVHEPEAELKKTRLRLS